MQKNSLSKISIIDNNVWVLYWTWAQSPESWNISSTYHYLNKEKWFSLQIPSTWTFQERAFNSLIVFFSPQWSWDTIKENLWITNIEISWNTDLDTYYDQAKSTLENTISNFKLVSKEDIQINDGAKIAQLVILPTIYPTFKKVESLDLTERGDGGFGSTGDK